MGGGAVDGGEVTLLGGWASPYVARVKLALHLKGVRYSYVEEDVLGGKSELLLRSNPVHGKVPVLIHGGRPVCESRVILHYLDEAFPGAGPPLLPAGPYERAVARFWAAFVEDELLAPWGVALKAKTEEERAECKRRTVAAVGKLEEGLRQCSGGEGFFGGERVGYVDVLLGGVVPWVKASEKLSGDRLFDSGQAPLLAAWMERFGELEAAKAVFQDVDALIDYFFRWKGRRATEPGCNKLVKPQLHLQATHEAKKAPATTTHT